MIKPKGNIRLCCWWNSDVLPTAQCSWLGCHHQKTKIRDSRKKNWDKRNGKESRPVLGGPRRTTWLEDGEKSWVANGNFLTSFSPARLVCRITTTRVIVNYYDNAKKKKRRRRTTAIIRWCTGCFWRKNLAYFFRALFYVSWPGKEKNYVAKRPHVHTQNGERKKMENQDESVGNGKPWPLPSYNRKCCNEEKMVFSFSIKEKGIR